MAEHRVKLTWEKGPAPFTYESYTRNHVLSFKDGQEKLMASASPAYRGNPGKADPEDLLVAALSSCHMLSFLAIATKRKLTVTSYEDEATGFLENDGGKLWMTRVILRPKVVSDADAETLAQLHHQAHQACFIANSVKTQVSVEPR
ncbi:MAG TPA: OsmC family protein [Rhizomicrobium sp.]|nr:OsmC family protein [Rhizomicrobium sp.]